MCETTQVAEVATEAPPDVQTFDTTADFLAAIQPGMYLCTSDFTGWAIVDEVAPDRVRGKRELDGRIVEVPAASLIDIRGGHCVRIDRVKATIDAQGWEID